MIEISSKTNDHFRRWSDLSSARGIKKHSEFILMGEKLIEEFLENPNFRIKGEIVHEDLKSVTMTAPKLKGQRIPVFKLPKALFNEIDVVGTHYNLLVLEPKEIAPLTTAKAEGLEVISPLGDPSNLGALARSSLAFGASKMILTEESCSPYHPKAIKASAGALLKLPLFKIGKFADFVSNNDQIYALDMKGESVANFKWPKNVRIALGEEGPGFSGIKNLQRLSVATQSVESLNATVAGSIALYSYSCQHR
ncbi:TrmH family RNA methyltransferase [Bdellovibrio bacteriovorus]|uniref:23S rRNA methyltransferase n=1 Tax=Bdellovibrio bacteriovorus (strain ATCC 15356 / DSM 50701 / NCIMB 9529 / HD100) TaxID=264462 RepID=Q6MMJ6_BDEBA|nr:TrmH family RNA methyltransferase [Bdellovibrio bacteriovorus]AHZ84177.1 23S rRNA methyltransferase [Bdellovibrio bacteriovorus]BEV68061.1 23S rRNA (guanosine-2'-O-)-methyltransferase RlmB [Bdellovibrio bacteriovorus]CAE79508.1 23S rRNA methyltransferase [Bdellovibrio bacteriovorus HD100]